MKAVRFHEHGGPEVLRYEDVGDPEPGEGDALIRLSAVGVNFVDTYRRAGAYPVELPHLPGSEARARSWRSARGSTASPLATA